MILHVSMELKAGTGEDREEISARLDAEKLAVQKMQRASRIRHIWRMPGRRANISIFEVDDADELQEVLSSLPLYEFLDISVQPLARHPASLDGDKA